LNLDRFRIETCIKGFEYLAVVADHSHPPASRLNHPDGSVHHAHAIDGGTY
jgi:hypothetical protein